MRLKTRQQFRQRVKYRIRRKVFGTAERPRLCVYRSLKHI
ncbi:MAG: 50S ribosomal protein L18, partial [Vicinamibacteria bacterium]